MASTEMSNHPQSNDPVMGEEANVSPAAAGQTANAAPTSKTLVLSFLSWFTNLNEHVGEQFLS